jgi:hypothetical protein
MVNFSKLLGGLNCTRKALFQRPFLIIALALMVGLLMTGCNKDSGRKAPGDTRLAIPANVDIDVTGRLMSVSWNAVDKALGYQVITTSVGCGSGNRTIDTKEGTAVLTSSGKDASNVEITGETSIRITLMAARGDPSTAMASAVTAKVMSLGGTASENVDSDYSEITSKTIVK